MGTLQEHNVRKDSQLNPKHTVGSGCLEAGRSKLVAAVVAQDPGATGDDQHIRPAPQRLPTTPAAPWVRTGLPRPGLPAASLPQPQRLRRVVPGPTPTVVDPAVDEVPDITAPECAALAVDVLPDIEAICCRPAAAGGDGSCVDYPMTSCAERCAQILVVSAPSKRSNPSISVRGVFRASYILRVVSTWQPFVSGCGAVLFQSHPDFLATMQAMQAVCEAAWQGGLPPPPPTPQPVAEPCDGAPGGCQNGARCDWDLYEGQGGCACVVGYSGADCSTLAGGTPTPPPPPTPEPAVKPPPPCGQPDVFCQNKAWCDWNLNFGAGGCNCVGGYSGANCTLGGTEPQSFGWVQLRVCVCGVFLIQAS